MHCGAAPRRCIGVRVQSRRMTMATKKKDLPAKKDVKGGIKRR
jgi:hypothetical protein